jgi:histidine ammonia-lyase
MAAHAARRLERMNTNLNVILGVEAMCAAQGIEFRAPLKTSPILGEALKHIRAAVPTVKDDRFLAPDIAASAELIASGAIAQGLNLPELGA